MLGLETLQFSLVIMSSGLSKRIYTAEFMASLNVHKTGDNEKRITLSLFKGMF